MDCTPKYSSKGNERKGKEKMIDVEKFKPLSAVKSKIDILIYEVNEYSDTKTELYDEQYEFRIVTFERKLKKKETLKMFIALKKVVMKAIKAMTLDHAMERKKYSLIL